MTNRRSRITERQSSVSARAVFLDRDGVINKAIIREGKAYSPRRLEEFVLADGLRKAVLRLKEKGYKIIVITNQPELARGFISRDIVDEMTRRIKGEIPVDDIFICPHDDDHQCSCRKPKPGMILEASLKWKLDLKASYIIGDTWKDMEAAKAAGCRTILLDAIYNQEVHSDFRARSLLEAVSIIFSSKGEELKHAKKAFKGFKNKK